MRLIDENLNHSDALTSIVEAEKQLAAGEVQLLNHEQRLEDLNEVAANRAQLEARREHLAQTLSDPIFTQRERWDGEETWIRQQQEWLESALDNLPDTMPTRVAVNVDIEQSPAKAVLEKIRAVSDGILEYGEASISRVPGSGVRGGEGLE